MACIPIPDIPIPTLPDGISLAPTFPSQSFDAALCCKVLNLAIQVPPIPIPPLLLNPAVATTIATTIKAVQDFIDQLPHDCPKELQRPT